MEMSFSSNQKESCLSKLLRDYEKDAEDTHLLISLVTKGPNRGGIVVK